jgi:phosphatidylglycerophosphate synthase
MDLGERISTPWLESIPGWVHPNLITCINHTTVWLLLLTAHLSVEMTGAQQFCLLIVTALLVYVSTILDCLDGMWARKSKQTSACGEFLDHYLDTLHIPFLTLAVSTVYSFPTWMLVLNLTLNNLLYFLEIASLYETKKFTHVAGVEGQVLLAGTIAFRALLTLFSCSEGTCHFFAVLVSTVGIIGCLFELFNFQKHVVAAAWHHAQQHICVNFVVLMILYHGCVEVTRFGFLIAFFNLAITGPFVGSYTMKVHDVFHRFPTSLCLILAICSILFPFTWPVMLIDIATVAIGVWNAYYLLKTCLALTQA